MYMIYSNNLIYLKYTYTVHTYQMLYIHVLVLPIRTFKTIFRDILVYRLLRERDRYIQRERGGDGEREEGRE